MELLYILILSIALLNEVKTEILTIELKREKQLVQPTPEFSSSRFLESKNQTTFELENE